MQIRLTEENEKVVAEMAKREERSPTWVVNRVVEVGLVAAGEEKGRLAPMVAKEGEKRP